MNVDKKLVISTRYSTDMQNPKSCSDQERDVRAGLTKKGIDHSDAIVIYDAGESGTKTYRDEYARLEAMVRAGEIGILAVDDQSRLSRADNVFAFITDVVYSGGRFISTGEGIDTEETGWELRVKVMELHNSTTILELGRRVRRGQLGRVLSQLSAGDFPYAYRSFLVNPDAVRDGRGPKPERGVMIHEEEAEWIGRSLPGSTLVALSLGSRANSRVSRRPAGTDAAPNDGETGMCGEFWRTKSTLVLGAGDELGQFGIRRGRESRFPFRRSSRSRWSGPNSASSTRTFGIKLNGGCKC